MVGVTGSIPVVSTIFPEFALTGQPARPGARREPCLYKVVILGYSKSNTPLYGHRMIETTAVEKKEERLATLSATGLLDTPIEERFERMTRMVCRVMDVPVAVFNLVDENRQFYKSIQGASATSAPLDGAFCTHTLDAPDMLLVPDARADARFADSPFVTGKLMDIGFYAGCPVRAPNGVAIGTLCAIDTRPRDMSPDQLMALRDLAAMLETELRAQNLSRTQEKMSQELDTAQRLAMVDPLTRLWNRAGMDSLLNKEWSEALRQKKPITLVMADIDHFKKVNDTYGHPAGDVVLKTVGKRLLEFVRAEDIVGRMGGEEFLIALTDCQPAKAFDTVDRLRQAVSLLPIAADGSSVRVTISFGVVSCIPQEGAEIERLLKTADECLYKAKNSGRNRVIVHEK